MMRKTGIVTGAASGLGYEFSNLLAKDSYDLVLVDNNEQNLIETKQKIEAIYPINVCTLVCDLRKSDDIEFVYEQVKEKNVEVLINNAGFGLYGFFAETDWKIEESMIQLHVLAVTHLTKLVLKDMIRKGRGKILNVSSVAAFQPGPLMAIYYATKAFILSFSEALANEVKGTGVTVTVLCPGQTKTKFQEKTALNSKKKQSKLNILSAANAAKVALYGYNDMISGDSKSVPGLVNKIIVLLSGLTPSRISVAIIRRVQERIRK